jgi:hypothetical protein
MALIEPRINVGPDGPKAWPQEGYTYGVNDSGPFQRFKYRGTTNEVRALASQFNVSGWTWSITYETHGFARLEAETGFLGDQGDEEGQVEDVWELDPNETQKNLLEADFPFGSLEAISKANKDVITDALDRPKDFRTSNPTFSGTTTQKANALSMYLLLKAKHENFPVEATVIRRSRLVSNSYTVQASQTNSGRIISSASMSSLEGVPGDILFSVPTPPTVVQLIETAGDLKYGWRKVRPNVTRSAFSKWRIVQTWQFGLWPVKIYGAVL